jgi:hypothetical protein
VETLTGEAVAAWVGVAKVMRGLYRRATFRRRHDAFEQLEARPTMEVNRAFDQRADLQESLESNNLIRRPWERDVRAAGAGETQPIPPDQKCGGRKSLHR